MSFTFRTKLLASYLGLVVAVEAIAIAVLDRSLAADLAAHLDERLEQQARGAAAWVAARHEQHGARANDESADRQAGRLANVVRARVTIFDARGAVLGDSRRYESDVEDFGASEADQPELIEARAGRVGRSTRWSAELGRDMHFVAVPGHRGNVVRLAVPSAEIEATIESMRIRLAGASLLAFVVAIGLGLLAARVIARPLRAMTAGAKTMAEGNFRMTLPATARDEIGELARALESLASQLEARIGELTGERDRLSKILENMSEGVVVTSPDARVVLANPSFAELLGVGEVPAGVSLASVVRDVVLRDGLVAAMSKAESAQIAIEPGSRSLIVNVRPLAGGAIAVIHDITRQKQLEIMRRDFVANVSHELRTPVTAIQGYAETLLRGDGALDAKTRAEFLDVVHRHARRIGRLVEDLLRLADIESRAPEQIRREPVRIADVAANASDTARDRLAAKGIALEIAVEESLIAIGDPDFVEQVFDNLIDNAIKYGRAGGRVRVEGKREGERAIVSVADDGPGIGPEHRERIFERFYRVDAGRSREVGGAGLGLAIVKRLVESMGGTIRLDGASGSKFVIDLPAASR